MARMLTRISWIMKMYILYNACFFYGPVLSAVKLRRITKSENEPDSDIVGET